ncbi:MAG TPA: winged helix-turn-helix domain-containing protein [Thermoplasmata archaeon]|nr:winged helix-turn-helix domain-containing protein [Thermoplasmata archaeon]
MAPVTRTAVHQPESGYPGTPYVPNEDRCLELLRFLILGTRGGQNRARILALLLDRPRHANELARELDVNYGTVTRHLRCLMEAGLVLPLTPGRYAQAYAVAPVLRKHVAVFEELQSALQVSRFGALPKTTP